MPHHLPKLFRIRLEQALKAVGSGESVVDTLDTLRGEELYHCANTRHLNQHTPKLYILREELAYKPMYRLY